MLAKDLANVLKRYPNHEVVVEDAELQIIGIKLYSYNKIKLITNGYFSNRDRPSESRYDVKER